MQLFDVTEMMIWNKMTPSQANLEDAIDDLDEDYIYEDEEEERMFCF